MVSSVIVEFDLPDELDFYALMFKAIGFAMQRDVHFASHRFAVKEQIVAFFSAIFIADFGHFALILIVQYYVNVSVLAETQSEETLLTIIMSKLLFKKLVTKRPLTFMVLRCKICNKNQLEGLGS